MEKYLIITFCTIMSIVLTVLVGIEIVYAIANAPENMLYTRIEWSFLLVIIIGMFVAMGGVLPIYMIWQEIKEEREKK